MQNLFRTLRHRMSWTNARKILNASGISTSHGWDGTLKKIAENGQEVDKGRLEDFLIEHILCGEKFTKLYPIDPAKRVHLQQAIVSATISDCVAAKCYPFLMDETDLLQGTGEFHIANVEREFRDFGETGIAEIIDGSYLITKSTRRFTTTTSTGSYQLKLRFNDKKGKEQIVFTEVDGSVFDKVGLGLKVPIVYSSKNINFIKVITDEKAYLKEYKKRIEDKGEDNKYEELISNNGKSDGSRNINVSDMMALDTLSANNILDKLNNVSQIWENITDVSAEKWANSKRGEMIYKNLNGIKLSVFYGDSICSGVDPHKYLKYIGFKEISKDASANTLVRTFQHEDYSLTIKADKHPNDSNAFVIDYNLNRKHQSLTSK